MPPSDNPGVSKAAAPELALVLMRPRPRFSTVTAFFSTTLRSPLSEVVNTRLFRPQLHVSVSRSGWWSRVCGGVFIQRVGGCIRTFKPLSHLSAGRRKNLPVAPPVGDGCAKDVLTAVISSCRLGLIRLFLLRSSNFPVGVET